MVYRMHRLAIEMDEISTNATIPEAIDNSTIVNPSFLQGGFRDENSLLRYDFLRRISFIAY
jgi:hypothetical protein